GEGKTAPPGTTRQKSSGKCVKSGACRAGTRGFAPERLPAPEEVQDEGQDDAHHQAGDEGEVEGERSATDQDVAGQATEPRAAGGEHQEHADQEGRGTEDAETPSATLQQAQPAR